MADSKGEDLEFVWDEWTAMHREGKGVGWLIVPEQETLFLWINVSIYTEGNLWQYLLKQKIIGNHINTSPWK